MRIIMEFGGPLLFLAGVGCVMAALWLVHPILGLGATGMACMALAKWWARAVQGLKTTRREGES